MSPATRRATRRHATALTTGLTTALVLVACTPAAPSANEANRVPTTRSADATAATAPSLVPATTIPTHVPLDDHPRRLDLRQTDYPDPGPRLDGETPGAPVHLAPGVPAVANQFWTSLIAAGGPSRLWLTPLAVEFSDIGLTVAQNDPVVDDDALVTRWSGQLRVEGDATDYEVTGYGDFSVSVDVDIVHDDGPASFSTTLAQGHPAIPLRHYTGPLSLRVLQDSTLTADGIDRRPGDDFTARTVLVDIEGGRWAIAADRDIDWEWNGAELSAVLDGTTLVLAPEPDDSTGDWMHAIETLALAPVSTTAATATRSPGLVHQELVWDGSAGIDRPVLLLPHHQTGETNGAVLGTFDTVYGTAQVVATQRVKWSAPLPGFLGAWPAFAADPDDLDRAMRADTDDDLADLRPTTYFGATDLARLTTTIDVLRAAGLPAADPVATGSDTVDSTTPVAAPATTPIVAPPLDVDALTRLATATIEDRLAWDGAGDASWITVDPDWNIPFAAQTEFKSELFNDRHFHQGYLLAAAGSMAVHDPGLVDRLSPEVDVLAASLLGPGMTDPAHWNDGAAAPFVGGGLFNPYLGHSLADGLSLSNRGNNQESSSEAVNAWAGVARWGAVTGRAGLEEAGLIRYAIESRTADAYWIRDGTVDQPAYSPSSTGIIWGDRVEYRTFFSAADEAIVGIQLIPFGPATLLRAVPTHRDPAWSEVASGDRMWADLFVMERAQIDPTAVDVISAWLTGDELPPDLHHGHSWVTRLGWTTMLAELGQANDMVSSPPVGRAFDGPDGITLVASNLGRDAVTVEFTDAGGVVGRLEVPAGETATRLIPG